MANILISYISKLNKNGIPQKYTSYLNGDNAPAEISGRQTNEAGTKALINYLSRTKNNSYKNINVSEKEIRELTDAIYLAGFSKDGITKEKYEKCIIILRKI